MKLGLALATMKKLKDQKVPKEKNEITDLYLASAGYEAIKKISVIKVKVKLVIVVTGDLKAPFSIATTTRCSSYCSIFSLDCSTLPLIRTL